MNGTPAERVVSNVPLQWAWLFIGLGCLMFGTTLVAGIWVLRFLPCLGWPVSAAACVLALLASFRHRKNAPQPSGIRTTRGIVAVLALAALLIVAQSMLLYRSVRAARDYTMSIVSESHLLGLGMVVRIHGGEYGQYPPALSTLVDSGDLQREQLVAPSDPNLAQVNWYDGSVVAVGPIRSLFSENSSAAGSVTWRPTSSAIEHRHIVHHDIKNQGLPWRAHIRLGAGVWNRKIHRCRPVLSPFTRRAGVVQEPGDGTRHRMTGRPSRSPVGGGPYPRDHSPVARPGPPGPSRECGTNAAGRRRNRFGPAPLGIEA